MLIIEGIRIKYFRVLRDVTLGCTNKQSTNSPLTSIIAVTGKNGRGKSTLFDAFAFMMIRLQALACGWILYLPCGRAAGHAFPGRAWEREKC